MNKLLSIVNQKRADILFIVGSTLLGVGGFGLATDEYNVGEYSVYIAVLIFVLSNVIMNGLKIHKSFSLLTFSIIAMFASGGYDGILVGVIPMSIFFVLYLNILLKRSSFPLSLKILLNVIGVIAAFIIPIVIMIYISAGWFGHRFY